MNRPFVARLEMVIACLLVAQINLACNQVEQDSTGYSEDDQALARLPGIWSMVILPDTQYYVRDEPDILSSQVRWIMDNRSSLDIRFVGQLGDVVQNDTHVQWFEARRQFDPLLGHIPTLICMGNHDLQGNGSFRSSIADQYFRWSDFVPSGTVGGRLDRTIWNTFTFVEGYEQDWLILALEFGPRDHVVSWANSVITNFPDHLVIVMTHAYLYSDNQRYDYKKFGLEQSGSPYFYGLAKTGVNDGQQLWDKLISKHSNIKIVLSGHVGNDGLGILLSTGENGNDVYQILSNYQKEVVHLGHSRDESGFLRTLAIDERSREIQVSTYSPWLEETLTDVDNQFVIDY